MKNLKLFFTHLHSPTGVPSRAAEIFAFFKKLHTDHGKPTDYPRGYQGVILSGWFSNLRENNAGILTHYFGTPEDDDLIPVTERIVRLQGKPMIHFASIGSDHESNIRATIQNGKIPRCPGAMQMTNEEGDRVILSLSEGSLVGDLPKINEAICFGLAKIHAKNDKIKLPPPPTQEGYWGQIVETMLEQRLLFEIEC